LVAATFGELKPNFPTPPKIQRFSVARNDGKKKSRNHQICVLAFYSVAEKNIKG
jgi:hypothetical protein